jgi:hypothetical protein
LEQDLLTDSSWIDDGKHRTGLPISGLVIGFLVTVINVIAQMGTEGDVCGNFLATRYLYGESIDRCQKYKPREN